MSVTAYPVIKVDSTNGSASDTTCSGAGPGDGTTTGPKLTGTGASTDGTTGTTVTLDAGTDLTNVVTDGSHVLYLADTTAGHRRFSAINGKSGSGGSTPQVTVEQAYTTSLSGKSWAIGGVRATIGGSVSVLLWNNNNSGNADAAAGWVEEMQSGHTETISSTFSIWAGGSVAAGPVQVRGTFGAVTPPVVTFSNDGQAFRLENGRQYIRLADFDLRNSAGTKTASIGVLNAGAAIVSIVRVTIRHATNYFWKGVNAGIEWTVRDGEIAHTASDGMTFTDTNITAFNMSIHDCGRYGVYVNGGLTQEIVSCLIYNNADDGVRDDRAPNSSGGCGLILSGNTIYNNTGDGLEVAGAATGTSLDGSRLTNNIIANNGGYGINLSGTGWGPNAVRAWRCDIAGNDFYSNTSGPYFPTTLSSVVSGGSTANPTFANAGSGDFTPTNTALAGTATPTTIGGATNYAYPGAVQPQAAGGTTLVGVPFPGGQMLGL